MAGHFWNTVENNVTGKPVNGATILVYEDGATLADDRTSVTSGTLATIYSDDGVTTINQSTNPVTSDAYGYFEFYTTETIVVLEISYGGSAKRAIDNVDIIGGTIDSDVTTLAARVDKHDTLFGTSANATNLGTFTGSTIGDNEDVKTALQDLETELEATKALITEPSFNFTSDGEIRMYAHVAMTLTEQDTSGTGTVAYTKSTAAAPDTFSSATSPITLEAGAWLKVTASSVSTIFAVALKRTA